MIIGEGSNWGYVMSKKDYDECMTIQQTKLCDMPSIIKDLTITSDCVTQYCFKNSTENCVIRKLRAKNNLCFKSPEPNVWNYIAPVSINLEIIQSSNLTHLTVSGVVGGVFFWYR